MLNLAFLGVPEVIHEGKALIFSTRKALALLVYLAVERGLQPREKLTDLFWPESDEIRGRGSLRRALSQLRQSLECSAGANHHLLGEREML
ncbi:MAG: hypothetical protein WCS37_09820, partial [Chloroflexota bacterium]